MRFSTTLLAPTLLAAACASRVGDVVVDERERSGAVAVAPRSSSSDEPIGDADRDRAAPARTEELPFGIARADTPASERPPLPMRWMSVEGTSIVGFGLVHLVPPPDGPGRFHIRYEDSADGYGVTDNAQLFVLPGDAFARREMNYGSDLLAFTYDPGVAPDVAPSDRTEEFGYPGYSFAPTLFLDVEFTVEREGTYIVAYGPWTDPDSGRPPGDRHTFELAVTPVPSESGSVGSYAWIESEAGELISSNWTHRPMLARGGPIPVEVYTGRPEYFPSIWLEIRPLVLYDARLVRAVGEPVDPGLDGLPDPAALRDEARRLEAAGQAALAADRRERADDLEALARRRDRRMLLTEDLAEKFRRVPIRWR